MEYFLIRAKEEMKKVSGDNKGVTAVEIVLVLAVLVALVIIFKDQALGLVSKIWKAITENGDKILK